MAFLESFGVFTFAIEVSYHGCRLVLLQNIKLSILVPVYVNVTDLLSSNCNQIIKIILFVFYCGFEGLRGLPKDHRGTLRENIMLLNPSL